MDQYYEYLQSCIVGEQYIFEANYIYEYRKEIIMNEGVMDTLRSIKEAFVDFYKENNRSNMGCNKENWIFIWYR